MKMSNETFDTLKWIAQYLLPGFGAFYFTISKIWNLPLGGEIAATFAAVDTLLGVILGISTAKYNEELAKQKNLPG